MEEAGVVAEVCLLQHLSCAEECALQPTAGPHSTPAHTVMVPSIWPAGASMPYRKIECFHSPSKTMPWTDPGTRPLDLQCKSWQ